MRSSSTGRRQGGRPGPSRAPEEPSTTREAGKVLVTRKAGGGPRSPTGLTSRPAAATRSASTSTSSSTTPAQRPPPSHAGCRCGCAATTPSSSPPVPVRPEEPARHVPPDVVIFGDTLLARAPCTAGRRPWILAGAATAHSALALASLDRLTAGARPSRCRARRAADGGSSGGGGEDARRRRHRASPRCGTSTRRSKGSRTVAPS